jgi:orotidine-5'-phosphate decarboxylase
MSAVGRERLALAADLPLDEAKALYSRMVEDVGVVKVGLSLFVSHGPAAVKTFTDQGASVFLDLKLHDIPNTVRLAAMHAAEQGVSFLTVHAQGGTPMMRAAVEGACEGALRSGMPAPRILAVTVLTSLSDQDLTALGHTESASVLASRLGELTARAGVDGMVCSPREAALLKEKFGRGMFICTPGIRPSAGEGGDQQRAETPAFAIQAGADLLVVGRPIYESADPPATARAIREEIAAV